MKNEEKVVHTDSSTPYRRVMSASSMMKDYVYNRMNEEIGSLKEIMIDVPTGKVAYAVLAVGGFLGIGQRLFAVPWNALTLDEDRKCFVLDVNKERLENAPGFDKDTWPDMADSSWATRIDQYWGSGVATPEATERRGNPLGASRVPGRGGDDLGVDAGRRYDRETAGYSDKDVDERAREARRAIDSPEGESLRAAEQVGKSRARD